MRYTLLQLIFAILSVAFLTSCTVPVRFHKYAMVDPYPTYEDWSVKVYLSALSNTWSHSLDDDLFECDAFMSIPRDVPTTDTLRLTDKTIFVPGFTYRTSKYSIDLDSLQIEFEDSSGFHAIQVGPFIHSEPSSVPGSRLSTRDRVLIPTEIENVWVLVLAKLRKLDVDSTFSKQFRIKMKRSDSFRLKVPDWLNN